MQVGNDSSAMDSKKPKSRVFKAVFVTLAILAVVFGALVFVGDLSDGLGRSWVSCTVNSAKAVGQRGGYGLQITTDECGFLTLGGNTESIDRAKQVIKPGEHLSFEMGWFSRLHTNLPSWAPGSASIDDYRPVNER